MPQEIAESVRWRMALPGWYSLPSVVGNHAALEAVAVIFFVALVLFEVWARLDKKRVHLLESIGLICFAVAVLAEVCAYPYSRRVDTLSSEANAVLNKEAGDARKEAGMAMERASGADERSKLLEAYNLKLRNDLSSADIRLTAEQAKLQEAQRETAKAQKETVDVQQRINGSIIHRLLDRHVDIRLKESLKTFPPALAEVSCIGSDTEAIIFALEIRSALLEGGWSVAPFVNTPKVEGSTGVTIVTKSVEAFFPVMGDIHPAIVAGLLGAGSKTPVDDRLAVLVSILQVRSLKKDTTLADGVFRIIVGENVLFNGMPLPPR